MKTTEKKQVERVTITSDYNSVIRYYCDMTVFELQLLKVELATQYAINSNRPTMLVSDTFEKWHTFQFERNSRLFAQAITENEAFLKMPPDELRDIYKKYQYIDPAELFPNKGVYNLILKEIFE